MFGLNFPTRNGGLNEKIASNYYYYLCCVSGMGILGWSIWMAAASTNCLFARCKQAALTELVPGLLLLDCCSWTAVPVLLLRHRRCAIEDVLQNERRGKLFVELLQHHSITCD